MATENSPSLVQTSPSSHSEESSNTTPERKKNSVIWLYFVVDVGDKTKAICQSCKDKVSHGGINYKSFNTSNLRKHLQGHPAIFEEFLEKEKEKKLELQSSRKTGSHKQVTLEALAERKRPYSIDHPRAKSITYRIAEMIAVDFQPFSLVKDIGFCRLMAEIEPRYVLPSRRYFSDMIIPSIYVNVKLLVVERLSSTDYISVTTDI